MTNTYSEGDTQRIILLHSLDGGDTWVPVLNPVSTGGGGTSMVIRKNGVDVGTEAALNLVEGTNIALTVTDDTGDGEIQVTINCTPDLATQAELDAAVATLVAADATVAANFASADATVASNAATALSNHVAAADPHIGYVLESLFDTKGDIITATANDTPAKLAAGSFGQAVVADSAETTGLIYANPVSLSDRYLAPANSYENTPRTGAFTNQNVLTSGTVCLNAIALPKNKLITSISFYVQTTAAVTPTNWWYALCDSSWLQLRATPDQLTGSMATGTLKTVNLASTFTTTYEGLYYVAIMVAAATPPTLTGVPLGGTAFQAIAPVLTSNGITGQTVPRTDGTALATSMTGKVVLPYCFVT